MYFSMEWTPENVDMLKEFAEGMPKVEGPYGSNDFWCGVESMVKDPGNIDLYGLFHFTAEAMAMKWRKEVSVYFFVCFKLK